MNLAKILKDDAGQIPPGGACWITAGDISIWINHFSDSVNVRFYVKDCEAENDAMLDECEVLQQWAEDYRQSFPLQMNPGDEDV